MMSVFRPPFTTSFLRLPYTINFREPQQATKVLFQKIFKDLSHRPALKKRIRPLSLRPAAVNPTLVSYSNSEKDHLKKGFDHQQWNQLKTIDYYTKIINEEHDVYRVATARFGLARVYRVMGFLDKAIQEIQNILKSEANAWHEGTYSELAKLYHKKGDAQKVLEVLKEGIETFPDSFDLNYSLGLFYAQQQEYEQALPYFKAALKIAEELLLDDDIESNMKNLEEIVKDLQAKIDVKKIAKNIETHIQQRIFK
jgi:tetratricopeptide (TPR) repeat protein